MKAIDLTAALIAANNINLGGTDALVETSILKQLIESCKTRIDALDKDAKSLAASILAEHGAKKGKFEHLGHTYTLDCTPVYNLEDFKRYKQPEAVQWRKDKRERDIARKMASSYSTSMKSQLDNFIKLYSDTKSPDDTDTTLKCLD